MCVRERIGGEFVVRVFFAPFVSCGAPWGASSWADVFCAVCVFWRALEGEFVGRGVLRCLWRVARPGGEFVGRVFFFRAVCVVWRALGASSWANDLFVVVPFVSCDAPSKTVKNNGV